MVAKASLETRKIMEKNGSLLENSCVEKRPVKGKYVICESGRRAVGGCCSDRWP